MAVRWIFSAFSIISTAFTRSSYFSNESVSSTVSFHTYKEDLKLLGREGLGLNAYRTSINWSRIFPNGEDAEPNKEGLAYYDRLIDEIIKNGMIPMLTISHYEMPLNLALKYNGWHSRKLIGLFNRYCKVVFDRYHEKVKLWILVNQINLILHESFNHLGVLQDALLWGESRIILRCTQ